MFRAVVVPGPPERALQTMSNHMAVIDNWAQKTLQTLPKGHKVIVYEQVENLVKTVEITKDEPKPST